MFNSDIEPQPVADPKKIASQAQYDWLEKYKPDVLKKLQAERPIERASLPERLGPKEDVIYIPQGNGKVFKWRM
jgi:hypothetical protein